MRNKEAIVQVENEGNEVKEKRKKQANNVKTLLMAVMLLGAGGALQKANADNLKFSPILSDKSIPVLNIPNVDFKDYDTSVIDKIGSICDLNPITGNKNKKYEDTSKEQKCVDTGIDAYDLKYDKKQDEIIKKLDKTADELRKDTANKKIIIKKLKDI